MFSSARSVRSRSALLGAAVAAALACSVGTAPTALADDMRSKQWYLDAMDADAMWKVSTGSGVTVAVVDSGVDDTVPELKGRVLPGKNIDQPAKSAREDTNRHGTNMGLLIAGSGAQGGVKGLAPGAKVLPVKAYENVLPGLKVVSLGIRAAADTEAKIISVSLGGSPNGAEDAELKSAVDYALKKGKLIFAAAGNDELDRIDHPGAYPGVVAVSAIDFKGKVTQWSNHGAGVGLAAPGDEIPGYCTRGAGYCASHGTSQATALTSATAALIWSAHPDWTGNQVLRVMMETAGHNGKVPSQYIGYGTVRPAQVLLKGNGNPGPADVNPLLAARGGAAATTSPSPADTADKGAGGGDQEKPQAGEAADSASEDKDSAPWTVIAIIAAAVVLIGGAVAAVRVRNKRA
ncbi:S8 family serine peptidase [Streptomyces sp. BPTC-684]|uniref:S8 family serine peptidase n=1 Tax=Streptomyces sp. BPTC-684 TaxID=3043734 RepID=UPI0024B1D37F|nr:S8 family serine peptidase [Streptomyces sp. BPTC-684]WHM36205.1 S8 family serine peptidase [Streptomyces sp. BPTC-684]